MNKINHLWSYWDSWNCAIHLTGYVCTALEWNPLLTIFHSPDLSQLNNEEIEWKVA